MAYEVTLDCRAECICAKARGRFEMASALKAFNNVLAECTDKNKTRVLFDNREVEHPARFFDVFRYLETAADYYQTLQKLGCPRLKLAYVLGGGRETLAEYSQEVGQTRGLDVLVTTDVAAAQAWLGVEC